MTPPDPSSYPPEPFAAKASGKPLCVDLFCGYGGWARGFVDAGYRVVGFDNEPKCASRYRETGAEFVLADVRTLDGARFRGARVIVASPPCTEFSTLAFLRRAVGGRPPEPWGEKGIALVHEAARVISEAEPEFWCIENVRGAERYIGKPQGRNGAQSLWGFFPGFIASPTRKGRVHALKGPKDDKSRDSRRRAFIPYPLARALAEACLP